MGLTDDPTCERCLEEDEDEDEDEVTIMTLP
jgi:hypothetical protein